jgi:RNA polymerase sigma-70 factor, ECF subfamily
LLLNIDRNLQKVAYPFTISINGRKKKADNRTVSNLSAIKNEGGKEELSAEHLLVARVQTGDFTALEELYNRYSRAAFGLAYKVLNNSESAEDAVHDAFLRFWKQPENYDPKRGRFVTWLLSVVHNLCIDFLRRKQQSVLSLDQNNTQDYVAELADQTLDVEEEVWLGMQRKIVRQALGDLPDEQRFVIELAFFKGLTHQEIADHTGQPLGTVKSRIRQGLKKLKDFLQGLELRDN